MTPERLSIQRRIVAVCHHDSDGLKTADRMEVPTPGRPRGEEWRRTLSRRS